MDVCNKATILFFSFFYIYRVVCNKGDHDSSSIVSTTGGRHRPLFVKITHHKQFEANELRCATHKATIEGKGKGVLPNTRNPPKRQVLFFFLEFNDGEFPRLLLEFKSRFILI